MSMVRTTVDEPLDHDAALDLQAEELRVTLELLRGLSTEDWSTRVPACPDWDVRQMYLHVLGACEGAAMGQMAHQMAAAMRRQRREGGPLEANLSAVQVADRQSLSPAQLVERLTAAAPLTIRRRRRIPAAIRNSVSMKVDGPVVERWRLGYLLGTIYLRDMWLHRMDACAALGREPDLRAEHDGRIVADVVAEWARRHGGPFDLTLTGPAGVRCSVGEAGEPITMDAVEFCRVLSGRRQGEGLLTTVVPF